MKGIWSNEEIADAAMDRYPKNIDYIINNFEDPKKHFGKVGHDINKLSKYAFGIK